jgi:replicative DNA helicase
VFNISISQNYENVKPYLGELPHNIDAEQSVLGTILIDEQGIEKVTALLTPEHFHVGLHNDIYSSMVSLHGRGDKIDLITTIEETLKDGVFENQAEARSYLLKIAEQTIDPSSIVSYAGIITKNYNARQIISRCADIMAQAQNGNADFETLRQLVNDLPTTSAAPVLIDGNTLRNTYYEPLRWNIKGLLHEGLVIYASMPKVGKSIHILNMCVAISSGAEYWGMETNQADVIYLGLEDSYRRLQDRINQMSDTTTDLSRLHTGITARTIDEGFLQQIDNYMKTYPSTGVIVVDVLQAVRGNSRKGRNAYEFDRHELQALKAAADKHRISLVVIHHDSKMKPSKGVVDSFSGSRGITGSADLLLSAFIEPDNAKRAKLFIKSREMESRCFIMEHSSSGRLEWDYVESPDYSENTDTRTKVDEEPNAAEIMLNELFKDSDRVPLTEINAKRDEQGINKVTLNRTRQKLGIKSTADKSGKTKNGQPVEWFIG